MFSLFRKKPDFVQMIREGAVVIDVRTPGEYKQGHAKGSVNIPLNELGNKLAKIKKYEKPIITCCASGMRSGSASSMLKSAGLDAHNGGPWHKMDHAMREAKARV
ncbi:MAG: rhodanese-like domain-containing protein [Bacteroidia bacterium]|nr:rhodanese-like domain-containing protein [Bacteroidia bacterium]